MLFDPILQTVEDKGNPEYVNESGPFFCDDNPWLGDGYYFWERFIKVAHWWGNSHYAGSYMICKASAEFEDGELLDLAGNTEQMEYFQQTCLELDARYKGYGITISFVIEYLKLHNLMQFKAVRAHSIDCGKGDRFFRRHFVEIQSSDSYLNLMPAMQLCVFDKSYIKGYKIIYPENYAYVV